jgi:hypothetical protein
MESWPTPNIRLQSADRPTGFVHVHVQVWFPSDWATIPGAPLLLLLLF